MYFFAIFAAYAIISSLADAYTPTNKYTKFVEWSSNSSQTANIPTPTVRNHFICIVLATDNF